MAKGLLARLNVDGSLDTAFQFCSCTPITRLTKALVQPDGKIIISGVNISAAVVYRINADGTLDGTFTSGLPQGLTSSSSATVWGIHTDGKMYVERQNVSAYNLYRLNADGSNDSSFATLSYGGGSVVITVMTALAIAADGRIYIARTTTAGFPGSTSVDRFTTSGFPDPTWEAPTVSGGNISVDSLSIQSDGNLFGAGNFSTVNGVSRSNAVRLLSAGNVDIGFTPPTFFSITKIQQVTGGKIVLAAKTSLNAAPKLFRINPDGSQDNTFLTGAAIEGVYSPFSVDASDRAIFFGRSVSGETRYYRLNVNGDVDSSFNPSVGEFGKINAVAYQSDGKVVFAGAFNQLNGVVRLGFARVNGDGTIDPTFNTGTGFNRSPIKLIVQGDGKIIAAGPFSTYNGTATSGVARINSDGTLDATFSPVVTSVTGASLQSDSKILVYGSFSTVNGSPRTRLARLNSDGSLDASFNAVISSGIVYVALQQMDGKIMLGGQFNGVDGFNRANFVRLNATGSLDQTFNALGVSVVKSIVVQPNGKYLFLGDSVARRNEDGTTDSTFVSRTFTAYNDGGLNAMLLASDGSVIVGGTFYKVGDVFRSNLVRLSSTGTVDGAFFPEGANGTVRDLFAQPDGKVILAGDFSKIGSETVVGIGRIIPGLFSKVAMFDYDGDGRADVSVFRASENKWYVLRSSDGMVLQKTFAIAGDVPAPADFDGDGLTDIGIFRPSNGDWWSSSSINNNQINAHWGQAGDIALPSDFDGDGRADYAVFRPSTNQWLRSSSLNGIPSNKTFGLAGDKPVIGDFDGDGKSDVAIYRPSDGNWWWQSSVDNVQRATRWGISSDVPSPADFDGDGKTDFAVYRPSAGVWYVYNSGNGSATIVPFGIAGDKPVAADYDGDGKADLAVVRPSTGIWYLLRSTSGFTGLQFGISTDIPTENAFITVP